MNRRSEKAVAIPGCTGAVIAGGRASRLGGIPKGLLRLEGEPLVARTLRVFDGLFEEALLVANEGAPYRELGLASPPRVVGDLLQGMGAPGGLHAALAAARTDWVFTVGCDMPRLAAGPIERLWALRGDAPGAAVIWKGRLQPLHAFWARAALPEVERMLRAGEPSMWQLATALGVRFVDEAAWREIDPEGAVFENVNTPADAARLGLEVPTST
jgi:molybdenum cofactor guanylyltransferase